MNENFEEYILDRKDKAGNFKKLINFYTNIWADPKNDKYLKNDKELYESFKKNDEEKKCKQLNQFYSAGIKKKRHLEIIQDLLSEKEEIYPQALFLKIKEKLPLYKSFISKYCHWHHEVNKSQNHFPIFDKNVKYSLVYYQMTGAEIKSYEHLKHLVDKFIEEYLPKEYKDLDDEYKIESRNESRPENPEKLVGVNRIKLKLEIKIEENDFPSSLHEEISIYRLVDKFLWLQYKIHSKILKKI
jgi:hypothetical protein